MSQREFLGDASAHGKPRDKGAVDAFGVEQRGDVISHHQVLRSVSDEKTTKLGTGRFWVIDIVYHNQDDELVGIESYTGFGYTREAS